MDRVGTLCIPVRAFVEAHGGSTAESSYSGVERTLNSRLRCVMQKWECCLPIRVAARQAGLFGNVDSMILPVFLSESFNKAWVQPKTCVRDRKVFRC